MATSGKGSFAMRASLLLGLTAVLGSVYALETAFELQFEYENPGGLMAGRTTVGGPSVHWNTQPVVAGFGMEQGAKVELQGTDLRVIATNNSTQVETLPVVFSLYDVDQWRAYTVLKLREVHIRSDYVLCHYPAAVRFAVPPADPKAALPWILSFGVRKASASVWGRHR